MVTDSDIAYAGAIVRRLEEKLAAKKHQFAPEADIKALEAELILKKQEVRDLTNRKRRTDDQQKRDQIQKDKDDRRKRFA